MATLKPGTTPMSYDTATSAPSTLLDTTVERLNFSADNFPNAAKLMNSLRHLGYDNYAAVKDLCDNCNDAHASEVHIFVDQDPAGIYPYEITIVDNGDGMDRPVLDEALKLGSNTSRNEMADLGKFGMGLVTASLSICRRVEVLTKQKGAPILYSVQDVDVITNVGEFVKHIGEAGPEEVAIFEDLLGKAEHGTIIILSKCDQLQVKNGTTFSNRLRKELGQTFRYFLRSDQIKMWVNDEKVEVVDPMLEGNGGHEFSRHTLPLEVTDDNGNVLKEQVEVRLFLLPEFAPEGNEHRKFNIPNQGFYLLRNFREIAEGETFGLFTKHNDFNRFRAEILVPGTLDNIVGVDFTKQKPKFTQAFFDKLNQLMMPQLAGIRNRLKSQRVLVEDKGSSLFHDEAARHIGRKEHLLDKPKLDTEKRTTRASEPKTKKAVANPTKQTGSASKPEKKEAPLPCRFQTASMTKAGPIWAAEPEGRTLVITWNIDHPFYQRFILDNHDNPSMVTATDYLVYSLCAAEWTFADDDDKESYETRQAVLENIRATVSNNMRQLLA